MFAVRRHTHNECQGSFKISGCSRSFKKILNKFFKIQKASGIFKMFSKFVQVFFEQPPACAHCFLEQILTTLDFVKNIFSRQKNMVLRSGRSHLQGARFHDALASIRRICRPGPTCLCTRAHANSPWPTDSREDLISHDTQAVNNLYF